MIHRYDRHSEDVVNAMGGYGCILVSDTASYNATTVPYMAEHELIIVAFRPVTTCVIATLTASDAFHSQGFVGQTLATDFKTIPGRWTDFALTSGKAVLWLGKR